MRMAATDNAVNAVSCATPAPSAPEHMEVSDTMPSALDATPSAPPYTDSDDGEADYDEEQLLQTLEQMGFPDRGINLSLLAAQDGNMEMVLEQLLVY